MKTLVKIGTILLITIMVGIIVLVGVIAVKSPGKTLPIAGENAIAELIQIELGGMKQWVLIRGNDKSNPVLLILHGGPGSPELAMHRKYNSALEKYFTVVNWEQRGSCKSYNKDIPKDTMKIPVFVSDARELVQYLKKRFNAQKIFLEGHSWGSAIGALLVQRIPQDIKAYIAIGQVSDVIENEIAGYDWAMAEAKKRNNKTAIKELTATGRPPHQELKKTGVERKWVMQFGGTVKNGAMQMIASALFNCREYTAADKILNYAQGSLFSLTSLWPEILEGIMYKSASEWKVPVYIMAGRHDATVVYALQEKYFNFIKAPKKYFFTFENSAHMCAYEEPEKYLDIMVNKVLKENN